ncbi:MAG: trimethylamine methyltransferase family protein [Rhodobacter sp.]|nr:trimethylamine methyltransferase family protein [Rhodobacter sp.]
MRRSPLRKQQANAAPIDIGAHGTNTRPYEPLTPAQVARLITEAIALMGDVGIRFEPGSEADQLLAAAGCSVCPDGVIRFPAALVRAALASCAKGTKIWNRTGDTGITIDTEHTWFMPGMTCIRIIDPVSGKSRDSTRDDLALITRIADGLPNIDAVCVACKDTPNSTLAGEIGEFVCLTENTTKPLEYLCEFTASLEAVIEMAALLRGGRAELAAKPYFLHLVTPLPVAYAKGHVEQILIAARQGAGGGGTVSFGGATSPITTAGCVLHSLATDFAAMVLAQVAVPGAFCIGGSISYFMEAATGAIGSTPQVLLAEQMVCQIRRSLGLPHLTGIGGRVRARRFSQDAVWEMSAMMMQHFYTRPATCDYLGLSDNGVTYSLHGLLMGNRWPGCCAACGATVRWMTSRWRWTPCAPSVRTAISWASCTLPAIAARSVGQRLSGPVRALVHHRPAGPGSGPADQSRSRKAHQRTAARRPARGSARSLCRDRDAHHRKSRGCRLRPGRRTLPEGSDLALLRAFHALAEGRTCKAWRSLKESFVFLACICPSRPINSLVKQAPEPSDAADDQYRGSGLGRIAPLTQRWIDFPPDGREQPNSSGRSRHEKSRPCNPEYSTQCKTMVQSRARCRGCVRVLESPTFRMMVRKSLGAVDQECG